MRIVVRTKEHVEYIPSYVKDFHRSYLFVYTRTFDAILEFPKSPNGKEVICVEEER